MPQSDSGKEASLIPRTRESLRDHGVEAAPRVYVLLMKQDDPRKCTAAKLARFRLATPFYRTRQIPRGAIVLNPYSPKVIMPRDRKLALVNGLVAVDCSWEKVDSAFAIHMPGDGRRLPTLLAANPVNYAKPHKLSSLEALAAALQVMGFQERAAQLLSIFKWGATFVTLNSAPLDAYASAMTEEEMEEAEASFF